MPKIFPLQKFCVILCYTNAMCFINVEFRGKVGQIVSTGDRYLAAVEENKVHAICSGMFYENCLC